MESTSIAIEASSEENTSVVDMTNGGNNSLSATTTSPSGNLIQDFYRGGVVLVTGATGFIGKALVEKLLRSCPDIAVVYLLMRPKRGQDVDSRYRQLLTNSVFDRLRAECGAHVLEKTRPVVGDIGKPGLDLSQDDRQRLIDEVDVVFHSAATVRFDEALQDAVTLNVLGTRSVIQLARQMPKLKALIYVSTAYSNAEKQVVEERVYPPPADPEAIIRLCPSLDNKVLEDLTESLLKIGHPNTYTLSKALAEWIVQEEGVGLPRVIVRPSIVGAAWREPEPGWVGTATGCTRLMLEVGRGVVRNVICKKECIADIIPIDLVVNTLIAASWRTATKSSNAVLVYNCTSGETNPTSWCDCIRSVRRSAIASPTSHVLWYPGIRINANRVYHTGCQILNLFIPALLFDIILRVKGVKPQAFMLAKMASRQLQALEFFSMNEWRFHTNNMKALLQDLSMSGDQDLFDFNIVNVQWDSYAQLYMAGITKYIHKETAESMEDARKKIKRLYWAHKIIQWLLNIIAVTAVISIGIFTLNCLHIEIIHKLRNAIYA